MALNVGDKVRYLNDVGGGTVIALRDSKFAIVLQDDGFDVPILIKECVVIEPAAGTEAKPTMAKLPPTAQSKPYKAEERTEPGSDKPKILLAFVPNDAREILDSDIDVFIVNDCNYYLNFVMNREIGEKHFPVCTAVIEPNTKDYLFSLERNDLGNMPQYIFSALLYKKDKGFVPQDPINTKVLIKASRLAKLSSYQKNAYFTEPVVFVELTKNELLDKINELPENGFKKALSDKEKKEQKIVYKSPTKKGEIIEVDLHIHQLLDNFSGMSNGEIITYQLDTFKKVLTEHKGNKGQKIVFIHGHGNGTLKTSLRKELDRIKIDYQDASFREYGFGATLVTIK